MRYEKNDVSFFKFGWTRFSSMYYSLEIEREMNLFYLVISNKNKFTYDGSGWPSASHSITNGLSLSFDCTATLNNNSSVGGCLTIRGGEFTENEWTLI